VIGTIWMRTKSVHAYEEIKHQVHQRSEGWQRLDTGEVGSPHKIRQTVTTGLMTTYYSLAVWVPAPGSPSRLYDRK